MKRTIDAFREGVFDLLILGGGITGAGVALDSVLRGFRVGLIDKGDFASGTSSASSKLIHGGLRYLEHGGFHLVYEALHERRLLLENAPHLVHPLRFIIPFYDYSRVPAWKYRAGLTLYDLLAGSSNVRRSQPLAFAYLRREFPGLRSVGLHGGACYVDAQMDDARLCLEVVHTAALHGACVANYVEAVGFERQGAEITGVRALDRVGGADFSIRARQIVNATGPWLDLICRLAGDQTGPHLRPTKGVHVIAPGRGLTSAFLLLHPADGRVFFVIPWLGKTLIGTTDTNWEQSPDALMVADTDIDYTLAGYNHYFAPPLERNDLLNTFAGLRPLVRSRSADPSALSREFQLFWSPSGLLSIAGGKYTTYRRMAEVVTDAVARRLGCRKRCRTRNFRLHGAPREAWDKFESAGVSALCSRQSIDEKPARHLIARYGGCAMDVAAYLERDRSLAELVLPGEPDLRAEFSYQRDHEMAIYPADHLLRRTRLGLFAPRLMPNVTLPVRSFHEALFPLS